MKYTTCLENGICVMRLEGRIDAITTPDFEAALDGLAKATEHPVLLDFKGVDYVGSLGLQVLVRVARILEERGIVLRLCGLQPFVAEVFRITHFLHLFRIDETAEAAIAAFGTGATEKARS